MRYQDEADFQLRIHRNCLSTCCRSTRCCPDFQAGCWRGAAGQGRDINERRERKGRKRKDGKAKGKQGRESDKGPLSSLSLSFGVTVNAEAGMTVHSQR